MPAELRRPVARAGVPFGLLTLYERVALGPRAEVYRAKLGRQTVACKRLLPHLVDDADAREQLQTEVAILRAVPPGAGVAPCVADDAFGARPWLATGWTAGLPLSTLIDALEDAAADKRSLAVARRQAVCGLWRALCRLHAAGWIHGDISARNALCCRDGRVVLIDLAAAMPTSAAGSPPRSRGTARYAAPEVASQRRLLPASDVFAAAALSARLWPADDPEAAAFLAQLHATQGDVASRPTASAIAAAAQRAQRAAGAGRPATLAALRAVIVGQRDGRRVGRSLAQCATPSPTSDAHAEPSAVEEPHTPPDDPTATRVIEGGWTAFAAWTAAGDAAAAGQRRGAR